MKQTNQKAKEEYNKTQLKKIDLMLSKAEKEIQRAIKKSGTMNTKEFIFWSDFESRLLIEKGTLMRALK